MDAQQKRAEEERRLLSPCLASLDASYLSFLSQFLPYNPFPGHSLDVPLSLLTGILEGIHRGIIHLLYSLA